VLERRSSRETSSRTSSPERAQRSRVTALRRGPGVRMRGAALLGAGALFGAWTLAAAPARAGDFEDGFEDQLGRIAAVSVVRFGAFLIQGAFQGPPGARAPAVYPPSPYPAAPYTGHPAYPAYPPQAAGVPPHTHPHVHAVPPPSRWGPPPSLWAEPGQAPCPRQAAVPYGEHVVYERYERTLTPPPQAAPAPGSRTIAY